MVIACAAGRFAFVSSALMRLSFTVARLAASVVGDGQTSRSSLASAVRLGRVSYRVVTHDPYGRSVAMAWAGSVNLSCWQLRRGHAAYIAKWDNGMRLASACLGIQDSISKSASISERGFAS